jgi:hypothetical protein
VTLNSDAVFNAIFSHAAASGLFERVNLHEPKNAPGNGLTAAVWVDRIFPVRSSGLDSVSPALIVQTRIFQNMLAEPQDWIDPNVTRAADTLMAAYVGDFSLGNEARQIDVFGQHGPMLEARAGYIDQDKKLYRVMTITIPVIINDAWTEVA